MATRAKKAGLLQTLSLIVFCITALLGTWALIEGRYGYAAFNLALMAVNFWLYQTNSRIITQELGRK